MREKRSRKQEMEEQAKGSAEAEPHQKQAAEGTPKRKVPAKDSLTLPGSSSPSSTTPALDNTLPDQKVPVRKLIPLKSKSPSPLNSSSTPCTRGAAVTSVPVKLSSSPLDNETESCSQSPNSSPEVPHKNTRSSTTSSPAKHTRPAPQGPAADPPTAEKTLNSKHKNSPEHTTDTKGSAP